MTHVLIVDDHATARQALELLLAGSDYEVETADSGAAALEQARRKYPDIVISDTLMPGMDGFALCRAWNAESTLREIPFVFIYLDRPRPGRRAVGALAWRCVLPDEALADRAAARRAARGARAATSAG